DTTTGFAQGVFVTFDYDSANYNLDMTYLNSGNISIRNADINGGHPALGANASLEVVATLRDGQTDSDDILGIETFTVEIVPTNDAPSQTASFTVTMTEDKLLNEQVFNLANYVTDPEGDYIAFSLRNIQGNSTTVHGVTYAISGQSLTITGEPDIPEHFGGNNVTDTIQLDIEDNDAGALFSFEYQIEQSNDLPRANYTANIGGDHYNYLGAGGLFQFESNTAIAITVALRDILTDPEGQNLVFPSIAAGDFVFSGDNNFVLDSDGDSLLTGQVISNTLTISGTPNITGTADDVTLFFDIQVEDTLNQPPPDASVVQFAFVIQNINDIPQIDTTIDHIKDITEESDFQRVLNLQDHFTDDDAESLGFTLSASSGSSAVSLLTVIDDGVSWTLIEGWGISYYFDTFSQLNFSGNIDLVDAWDPSNPNPVYVETPSQVTTQTLSLTITGVDSDATQVVTSFTIEVGNRNDAPVLQQVIGNTILQENTPLSAHLITLSITDEDNDKFKLQNIDQVASEHGIKFSFSTVSDRNVVTIEDTPNIEAIVRNNGTVISRTTDETITVSFSGYDNDNGVTIFNSFTLTIANNNDLPEALVVLDTLTINEDVNLDIDYNLNTIIGDAEGDAISYSVLFAPALSGMTSAITSTTLDLGGMVDIPAVGTANVTTSLVISAWEHERYGATRPSDASNRLDYTVDVVVANIDDRPRVSTEFLYNAGRFDSEVEIQVYIPNDPDRFPGISLANNVLFDQEGATIFTEGYVLTSPDLAKFPGGVLPAHHFGSDSSDNLILTISAWDADAYLAAGDAVFYLSLTAADNSIDGKLDPDRKTPLVITFSMDNPNDHAPEFSGAATQLLTEAATLSNQFQLFFTDQDSPLQDYTIHEVTHQEDRVEGINFTINGSDNVITLSGQGRLVGAHQETIVTDVVTFVASDGAGGTVTSSFTYSISNVDDRPVQYVPFETVSLTEDTAHNSSIALTSLISDPELDAITFGFDASNASTQTIVGIDSDYSANAFGATIIDNVLTLSGTPDFDGTTDTLTTTLVVHAFSEDGAQLATDINLSTARSDSFTLTIEVAQENDTPFLNVEVLEGGDDAAIVQTFSFDAASGWADILAETYTIDHLFIDTDQAPGQNFESPDLNISVQVLFDPTRVAGISFNDDTSPSDLPFVENGVSGVITQTLTELTFLQTPNLRGVGNATITLSIAAQDEYGAIATTMIDLTLLNPNQDEAEVEEFRLNGSTISDVASFDEDAAIPNFITLTFADTDSDTSISITEIEVTEGFNLDVGLVSGTTDNLVETISLFAVDSAQGATIAGSYVHNNASPEITIVYTDQIIDGSAAQDDIPIATYTETITLTIVNVNNEVDLIAGSLTHSFADAIEGTLFQ
nr:hypothetical protein [Alphaproteobacteria bacterium]